MLEPDADAAEPDDSTGHPLSLLRGIGDKRSLVTTQAPRTVGAKAFQESGHAVSVFLDNSDGEGRAEVMKEPSHGRFGVAYIDRQKFEKIRSVYPGILPIDWDRNPTDWHAHIKFARHLKPAQVAIFATCVAGIAEHLDPKQVRDGVVPGG